MAVFLNEHITHTLGYGVMFYMLGCLSLIAMYINSKVKYTFETYIPFVKDRTLQPDIPVLISRQNQDDDEGFKFN